MKEKRFYFFDRIVSLPFGHYMLEEVRHQKKESTESHSPDYLGKKNDLLKAEALAVCQCKRLRMLRSILAQSTILHKLDSEKHRKNSQTFPQEAMY